jgi:type IV pilus assembly protein PilV
LNNKGFSLLELLIGLVILAIGILAMSGLQITAIKNNYFSQSLTQATILAQDKIEELKNSPYANLIDGVETKIISGTQFIRKVNVTEDPGNNIKKVIVTVQWMDPKEHSIFLSTVVAK